MSNLSSERSCDEISVYDNFVEKPETNPNGGFNTHTTNIYAVHCIYIMWVCYLDLLFEQCQNVCSNTLNHTFTINTHLKQTPLVTSINRIYNLKI